MRRRSRATAWAATLFASLAVTSSLLSSSHAADLIWEVENPFRFFKPTKSFALHEAAFNAVRGDPSAPLPANVIWRTERQLNDPDCKDGSHPDRCAATAGKRYEQSRLGWAAQTLGETCYESNGRPRRYSPVCERKYSWGTAKEDYVLPEAHTVAIRIAPEQLANVTGDCTWSWQPRKAGGKPESNKTETKKLACKDKLTIARVPYAQDRANSGVSVAVKLPDGRELAERDVVVEDLFIVALGDSFASGESNPDKPVQFSPSREMVYDPTLLREQVAARTPAKSAAPSAMPGYGLASGDDHYNPKVLPRRLMDDEVAERFHRLASPEFVAAFDKAAARWLSRDCHRSQYGYPFRVAIELALENRHRSVTLASLTCSGATVVEGLLLDMEPREGASEIPGGKVRAQLDQLSELLCRGARSHGATYALPVYTYGKTQISEQRIAKSWCPPQARKRAIDVVLMSIGGNDVGFGALAAYALTEELGDLAPIAGLAGSSARFGPQVSRVYLDVLDHRMKAVKDALHEGFGVPPSDPIRRDRRAVRRAADARHGRASRSQARPAAAAGDRGLSQGLSRSARMHRRQQARRLPGQSRDRSRHRLHAGDGSHSRIHQARIVRARSQAGACRRRQHAGAATARERRRLQALLAGWDAALCPSLAAVPHAERRLPRRQYPPRRHAPVRHPAAGLCGALQRSDPPDR
jgi:hypothetical protein